MSNAPIGLLGGTFDPIHLGHLHAANTLYQEIPLQEVRFIPTYQPLLRTPPIANPQQRLTMAKLAIEDFPYFKLDDRELKRSKPSYTYDTLVSIRKELNAQSICFIIGIDQFIHFDQWHNWRQLVNLAHFIVINRPHYLPLFNTNIQHLLETCAINNSHLLTTQPSGYIFIKEIPPCPISATLIRQQIKMGNNVQALLPVKVWRFIDEHGLYQ